MQIFYFGNTHDLAKIYRKRRPAYELSPTAPCTVPGLGLEFGKLLANVLLNNWLSNELRKAISGQT